MILEIFTNPLTTFGDAGTLAAFGFLTAYFLISIAAPVYLKKIGELKPRHLVVAVMACVLLMVPLIGSFYPVPPYPVDIFPYIFLGYMIVGSVWLYITSRRRPGVLAEIEADLERATDHVKPVGLGPIGVPEKLFPEPPGADAPALQS